MVSVTSTEARTLEAIRYAGRQLSIIDQLALPHETRYIPVKFPLDTRTGDANRF
jgi:methylthioribose-1-phosphate isomerase